MSLLEIYENELAKSGDYTKAAAAVEKELERLEKQPAKPTQTRARGLGAIGTPFHTVDPERYL